VIQPDGWLYVDFLDPDDAEYGCGRELEEDTFLDPDGVPIHFSSWQEIMELLNGFTVDRSTRSELNSASNRVRVMWTVWAVRSKKEYPP
jgi:hypothetical protein